MANTDKKLPAGTPDNKNLADAFLDVLIALSEFIRMLAVRAKNENALRAAEAEQRASDDDEGGQ